MQQKTYLEILIRNWWVVIPTFLAALFAAYTFTRTQPVIYESSATYVVNINPVFDNYKDFASALDILSRQDEIAATFSEIANSESLKSKAAAEIGVNLGSTAQLSSNSQVIAGTNVLRITTESTNAELARNYAAALGTSTREYVQNLYVTYQLVPLDQPAIPDSPSSPNMLFNLAVGGGIGLVLGVVLAFLFDYMQNPTPAAAVQYTSFEPGAGYQQKDELVHLYNKIAEFQHRIEANQEQLALTQEALNRVEQQSRESYAAIKNLSSQVEGGNTRPIRA